MAQTRKSPNLHQNSRISTFSITKLLGVLHRICKKYLFGNIGTQWLFPTSSSLHIKSSSLEKTKTSAKKLKRSFSQHEHFISNSHTVCGAEQGEHVTKYQSQLGAQKVISYDFFCQLLIHMHIRSKLRLESISKILGKMFLLAFLTFLAQIALLWSQCEELTCTMSQ